MWTTWDALEVVVMKVLGGWRPYYMTTGMEMLCTTTRKEGKRKHAKRKFIQYDYEVPVGLVRVNQL
jgi:hypothetical protein